MPIICLGNLLYWKTCILMISQEMRTKSFKALLKTKTCGWVSYFSTKEAICSQSHTHSYTADPYFKSQKYVTCCVCRRVHLMSYSHKTADGKQFLAKASAWQSKSYTNYEWINSRTTIMTYNNRSSFSGYDRYDNS